MLKRLVTLLLALMMAFAFIGCGGDTPGDNGDNGGGTTPPSTESVEKYSEGVAKQLANIKTLEIGFTIVVDDNQENYSKHYTNSQLTSTDYDASIYQATITGNLILALNDNGYNAKIHLEIDEVNKSKFEGDDNWVGNSDKYGGDVYYIDGVFYNNMEEEGNDFVKGFPRIPTYMTDSLAILQRAFASTESLEQDIKSALNLFFKEAFPENNKQSVTIDFNKVISPVVDYVNSIDPKTTTVKQFVNGALALIDKDLDIDELINLWISVYDMKMGELVDRVDEYLLTKTGLGLQETYQKIVKNPLLNNILTEVLTEAGYQNNAQMLAMISLIKSIDIKEAVDPYKDLTLQQFTQMMMEGFDVVVPTTAQFVSYIQQALADTIERSALDEIICNAQNILDDAKFGANAIKCEVNYKDYKIDDIKLDFASDYDFAWEEVYNHTSSYKTIYGYHQDMALNYTSTIKFGDTETVIKLPDGANIVNP